MDSQISNLSPLQLEQVKETLEARAADAAKQVEQLMEEAKKVRGGGGDETLARRR